jgi:hypothetical protein
MGDDDNHYAPLRRTCHGDETTKRMTPARGVDKSGQGPNRAAAEAVALPLGIQPSIDRHCRFLLQIGQLLGCSYKLRLVLGATAHENEARIPE